MELLLIHLVLLVWLSVGAAARWTDHLADRFLAAGALGWANLLATALLLSPFHLLGHPPAFLGVSLGLALGTGLVATFSPASPGIGTTDALANPWWQFAAILTLGACALASAVAAANYLPSSPAALAYELPRALLQIGEGGIFPLHVADARQVLLPFNYGLLQTWALVYQPPLVTPNFMNLLSWGYAGLALYRLCRVAGSGANSALFAAWCALMAPPVLARAAMVDHGLPAAAALVAAITFGYGWAKDGRTASAAFAGLLAGLAGGSALGVLVVVGVAGAVAAAAGCLPRNGRRAAALGLVFGLLPFAINLVASLETGFPQMLASLQRTAHVATPLGPTLLWPIWAEPGLWRAPTENTVSLGLPGLACLAAAGLCLLRPPKGDRRVVWLSALALGWLGAIVVASRWLPVNSSEVLLAVLLAAPAVAASWDRWRAPRLGVALGVIVAAAAIWSAAFYLWRNASRPLAAVANPALVYPAPSQVPALLDLRIAQEQHINFSSDGEDPLLLLLMGRQRQHFGAQDGVAPEAYNLISRSHRGQYRTLRDLSDGPAHLLIAFPEKATAGVEYLGRMGLDEFARDYFGISGSAELLPPIPSNRTLLLTLSESGTTPDGRTLRADLRGLTPPDRAKLEIWGAPREGRPALFASFNAQGALSFSCPLNLHYLRMKIVSTADGRELGTAVLTDYEVTREEPEKPGSHCLFSAEFVGNASTAPVQSSPGLTGLEGPFPQWDLPFIRWARAKTIRLQISATPGLARIRLHLEARLHVRQHAILEVAGNGDVLRRVEFNDPTTWHDAVIEFPARPGENVIELRDILPPPEPDWVGYIERYPDVKSHAERIRQPLREAALEHYRLSGQREGRLMTYLESPVPDDDAYFFMFRRLRVEGFPP